MAIKVGFALIVENSAEIDSASALTQNIILAITQGYLAPGTKLPSVNEIASLVGLNRLTVLKSLDELEIEGWIVKKLRSGCLVANELPLDLPQKIGEIDYHNKALPSLAKQDISELKQNFYRLSFNDGYPDYRLFPSGEMARAYSTSFKDHQSKEALLYYDVYGHEVLRNKLTSYVHESRSIKCDMSNIFVTRGSTMGIYLVTRTVCEKGDAVAMAEPGYYVAKEAFDAEGLKVISIKVDRDGLDTEHLGKLLKHQKIKMLYVTPHHQYPTTVTMTAARRMELLKLAEKHNFYILEDDYDFDFQYDRRPILPIASIDQLHRVIYVGGFSKSLSPSIRLGYVVANPNVIKEMGKWRKIIDRQGDSIQELAFAKLLSSGVIDKTIRKAIRVYQERRDFTFDLMKKELSPVLEPNFCQGGLAFWTKFNMTATEVDKFHKISLSKKLYFIHPSRYSVKGGIYSRFGFASMNIDEISESVEILKEISSK